MTIYDPWVMTGYEWINTFDDNDYEAFIFNGQPRAETWKPIKVKRVRADHRQAFKKSDFPFLGGYALIMRIKTVKALRDILEAHGEILPLETEDGVELFVFNCRVVDALDEANSTIKRFASSGRIMSIDKAAFFPDIVRGVDMFRLPDLRASTTYLSERFIQRYKEAGLVGLEFKKVWSDTEGPVDRSRFGQ